MSGAAHSPPPPGVWASLATPPFGARGNGLPAISWVPVADLDPDLTAPVLAALRGAGIPACVAPYGRAIRWRHRGMRLWVDVPGYSRAGDLLARLLPAP